MVVCFVPMCSHNSMRESCRFYVFPKDNTQKKKWISLIRRKDREPNKNSRICSCHFVEPNVRDVPSLFPWNSRKFFAFHSPEKAQSKKRCLSELNNDDTVVDNVPVDVIMVVDNIIDAVLMSLAEEGGRPLPELNDTSEIILAEEDGSLDKGCQAKVNMDEKACQISGSVVPEVENYFLQKETDELKQEIAHLKNQPFQYDCIKHKDILISFYTGIPNKTVIEIFFDIFTNIEINYIHGFNVEKISRNDQMLMTLMKLRLNLKHIDLSVRFNCSIALVSNIVLTWIHVFHKVLYETIMSDLPSLHKIKICCPESFAKFPNCRMIMDCTEIPVTVPSEMDKQKETYSNYKHKNTLKGLVGIAPNGFPIYCSALYPGSVSDKELVKHCGVLDLFQPGDLILADKGFLIQDMLPPNVHLNIPPFLSTPQFTPPQVEKTVNIARARIHVERAIRRIKVYEILNMMSHSLLPYASKVWQVCCVLTLFQNANIKEIEPLLNML